MTYLISIIEIHILIIIISNLNENKDVNILKDFIEKLDKVKEKEQ